MNFQQALKWGDSRVFVCTERELLAAHNLPSGYSVAGVVLMPNWDAVQLMWLLNGLYGGVFASDEAYVKDRGARAFVFFGDRADLAHEICDALRNPWLQGYETAENIILTAGSQSEPLAEFVINVLFAMPLADAYRENRPYRLFVVPDEEARRQVLRQIQAEYDRLHAKGVRS